MPTTADHTFCPYKGLQPYTEADRKYFFGRTRDEGIIVSNLYAASVTVFYGASGVGKSSVLLAGAVPRLRQEPRDAVVAVFNRWQSEDFLGLLKNEVAKQANLPAPVDTALPLDEFLAQTQNALGLPLFMIFDQFEEYFLYHPPSPSAEVFESAFARAVNRRGTQINFFLSLREDGLSKLDRFKSRIPTLMNNMLRLEHLNRDAAKLAITQPLEEYNRLGLAGQPPMTIEPGLVRAILNDLQGAQAGAEQLGQGLARMSAEGSTAPIETPFLQMVLTRLWDEERAAGSATLRLQTFEALGRAANIASTHLDTMMARLNDAERETAARILRYLVTPSGSKIAQEAAALASWTEQAEAEVQAFLTRLSGPDMRILRTVQTPGRPNQYEIFHDVLARAILDWRARYVQEQKLKKEVERARAEELEARKRARAKLMPFVVGGLLVLLVVMGFLTFKAYQSTFIANASSLAVYSRTQLGTDPELSLLLATEAVNKLQIPQSIEALKEALTKSQVAAVMRPEKAGRISGVAFSPDGKYVVTASWNDTAQVWEAATGKSVSLLAGHGGDVNCASFSPDGKYVITGSSDNTSRVWQDWQTGSPKVVTTISERDETGKNEIWTAAFSPDNNYILTGGGEGKVKIWEWRNAETNLKAEINVSSSIARSIAEPSSSPSPTPTPTPDLTTDATATPSPTPAPKRVQIYKAVFSPDGEQIMIAANNRIGLLWNWKNDAAADNTIPLRGHRFSLYDAAFSPDGKYAITGSDDSTAIVWELSNPVAQIANMNLVDQRVRGVAFSPDGTLGATASFDKVGRLWTRASKFSKAVELRGHRSRLMCIAFSPDGKFVVTGSDDGTARLWRTESLDKNDLDGRSVADLQKLAAERVTRSLTAEERKAYYVDQ